MGIVRTIIAVVLLATGFVLLGSCSGGGGGGPSGGSPLPKPLAERYAIDGVVDLSVFSSVNQAVIDMKGAFGTGASVGTTTLRYAMANDERHLYIALEWNDQTPNGLDPASFTTSTFDGVVVMFDNNGNGTLELNEDARRIVMTQYGSSYSDIHSVPSGTWDDSDAVGDGLGKMTWSAGVYHAEFLIPLAPDAAGQDGVLSAATRFNINILDDVRLASLTGSVGSLSGPANMTVGMDSSGWPLLPYAVPAAHDQPVMPGTLTGLIVFISDHENPKGELYTFDPAAKIVTRVTYTTGLYMDCASLSHDRTRIAVHAAPTSTDFANFEIYTMSVNSGSTPTALTSNALLDGHPAWSPDDTKIVYASFYAADRAKLIVMSALTGSVLSSSLTPSGANDNDPDWLPDGRIVFKTDRFGTPGSPNVRIAIMNADGTLVTQLTPSSATSDHDPTATNTLAVFERFMKGTDYAHDPAFMFAAWNIIEARVDGSGERTLLADGWINWLPVRDSSGQYLVYLKTVGYTDARLMSRDGRDLGRLIPGITKVRYIDWK